MQKKKKKPYILRQNAVFSIYQSNSFGTEIVPSALIIIDKGNTGIGQLRSREFALMHHTCMNACI